VTVDPRVLIRIAGLEWLDAPRRQRQPLASESDARGFRGARGASVHGQCGAALAATT
jgi:hypothetical protein